jgi:hypothetical protein
MWYNFSLPTFSAGDDTIIHDRQSKTAVGLIYILTTASVLLGMVFFLFEYNPLGELKPQVSSEVIIYRPRLSLDLTREQVEKSWGQPTAAQSAPSRLSYVTPGSLILIQFNPQGKMISLTETRTEK